MAAVSCPSLSPECPCSRPAISMNVPRRYFAIIPNSWRDTRVPGQPAVLALTLPLAGWPQARGGLSGLLAVNGQLGARHFRTLGLGLFVFTPNRGENESKCDKHPQPACRVPHDC